MAMLSLSWQVFKRWVDEVHRLAIQDAYQGVRAAGNVSDALAASLFC